MSAKKNINNLKKVSTILPQIFKKINKKGNSQLLEIKMNWTSIIGKEYAETCHVSSLKKINQKNVLTVCCSDASLFELSYSALEIKEKINGFFLRNVVDIIKFKKLLQT